MSDEHTKGHANTTGEFKSAAQRAGATIQDTASKIGAETAELGEQVYEQGARGARYVSKNVEAQPLAALAIVGGWLVHTSVATRAARWVLPTPPGPVSVTRRTSSRRSRE